MDDKVNILVVDDLPDKRLAFQVVLEELGQNLVMASSGADALRELLQHEFAVILLDVNMPDIDGIETAELIRQHGKTKHTPIIFVTAYADEMQTARGYQLGAVDYILSPVVPEILRSKVKVFVELYRAQRRAQELARVEAEHAAAQEATRRSEFLAYASRELGASLNLDDSMERFLRLLVPGLAQFALLSVHVDDEALLMSCEEPGRAKLLSALDGLPEPLMRAISRARFEGGKRELRMTPAGPLPGHFQVIPLRSRAGTVAVLALGYREAPRAGADQVTIEELVSRAAIAFDNGRLYWNLKREMARTKEAEEKLQQAARRKDEFLAMLSHELRNPLAPIRNAAEVMRRIAPADPGIAWARDVVERQVTHLAQLVDDLLDVSRITQGKITLKKEPVELGKVIHHSIETARTLLDAKRHHLRLVELHQGRVEVRSDGLGKGALFRITLPCISEVPQEHPSEINEPIAPGQSAGKRILVIDDNIDAAESIAVYLRLEGHKVRTVNDGAQALSIAQVFAPHVAVVDIGLPGMDGYDVARRLKQRDAEGPALLIALTGYGQKEDRVRSDEAGFHHHFVKPADPRVIQAAIAAWAGRGTGQAAKQTAGRA